MKSDFLTLYLPVIGSIEIKLENEELREIRWLGTDEKSLISPDFSSISIVHKALMKQVVAELKEFISGIRHQFSIPIAPQGTSFQRRVWQELCHIPYGQTISYRELAKRAGNPQAIRAAGASCGANPIPLVIPCHRVLRSDGTLGGFGWGLPIKQHLLALEQHAIAA